MCFSHRHLHSLEKSCIRERHVRNRFRVGGGRANLLSVVVDSTLFGSRSKARTASPEKETVMLSYREFSDLKMRATGTSRQEQQLEVLKAEVRIEHHVV